MITLKEGFKLAIKHKACKGNREAFTRALDEGNELECYQIALGNYEWLLDRGIIEESDLPEIEKLANGIGKVYHYSGQIYSRANYKNGEHHGLREIWYENGRLCYRVNYKNGEIIS